MIKLWGMCCVVAMHLARHLPISAFSWWPDAPGAGTAEAPGTEKRFANQGANQKFTNIKDCKLQHPSESFTGHAKFM